MINGNPKTRRLLAPNLCPCPPNHLMEASEPLFYLSWLGWELYLTRRLNWRPDSLAPKPILLPDQKNPEFDFALIDQLAQKAAELGTGFLALSQALPDSLPGLVSAIEGYGQAQKLKHQSAEPVLDDRAYLALWSIAEYQARQSEELLARAAASQKAMWAALKGETEDEVASPGLLEPAPADDQPDRRSAYAWLCWRRLAGPYLTDSDIIIPLYPE